MKMSDKILWGICFAHGVAMLSNSYVMAEGRMIAFWISTIGILIISEALPHKKNVQNLDSSQSKGIHQQ